MENEKAGLIPAIAIVTVVYNSVKAIESTIINIKNLNYPNKKFFIIDGGSNDGTLDIIKKYNSIVTKWITEKDEGIYDAMNKGWQFAASDDFVIYLGAGDKIEELPDLELLKTHEILYGNVFIGKYLFKSYINFRSLFTNTIHHQALLIKKSNHLNPPFNKGYKLYGDFDFNLKLLKNKVPFIYVPNFTSYALPGGVSTSYNYREALTIVYKNKGVSYFLIGCFYHFFVFIYQIIIKPQSKIQ